MEQIESMERGFVNVQCPIDRCKHKHRFKETDQTLADPDAAQRRSDYLRHDHVAGHPDRRIR
jgi:hypothetical protein